MRLVRAGLAVAVYVLRVDVAELFAALLEDRSSRSSTLMPNSRSLSMPMICACGQLVAGVRLELDAFLEVDEIELHLVRAVVQREIADQRMQQRRFSGAGLAGDHHVLRRAAAQLQMLQLGGAGAAEWDVEPGAAVLPPQFAVARGDAVEGHLDAAGVFRLHAGRLHDLGEVGGPRRRLDFHGIGGQLRIARDEAAPAASRASSRPLRGRPCRSCAASAASYRR